MLSIASFTFSPFAENTYVLSNDLNEAIIIDPGCYFPAEKNELLEFIRSKKLNPILLLNTHCHLDHIFGNRFVFDQFGLKPWIHEEEKVVLDQSMQAASLYGVELEESPEPIGFCDLSKPISFGDYEFELRFTPGHSPGSVSFYCKEESILISGDVLFQGSIGRTDLPGGSMDVLMTAIKNELMTLPDSVRVYSGHGPMTTIGAERTTNPFILNYG